MNETIRIALNALVQIVIYALLPVLAWFIAKKKSNAGFFEYVGLIRPKLRAKWWVLAAILIIYCCIYNFTDPSVLLDSAAMETLQSNSSITANEYAGIGMAAFFPLLITSFVQNGFCEELLFRGLLCKRLIKWTGMPLGIFLQAAIFALMHNLMFMNILPHIGYHVLMFCFITIQTSVLGVVNEKIFNGSIWPSIILHGLGNFIGNMLVAFS